MTPFHKINEQQIKKFGLAGKLSGMVCLIALIVYIPSILFGAFRNLNESMQSLEEYKKSLEMRVQNVFEPAIWNYDIETLTKLISTELRNKNLKSIRINANDRNIVWLTSEKKTIYVESQEPIGRYYDKRTIFVYKLNVSNQVLAQATIWYDHSESRSRFFYGLVDKIIEMGLVIAMIAAGITISSYISLVRPLESIRISMLEAGKSSHHTARKRIETVSFKKSFSEIRSMALDLEHMLSDIDELNNELEAKVVERTIELENAKYDLEKVIVDLKAAQAQLISHEKMAVLGQLVSGIAHELNTPLGVVTSAGGTLDSIIKNEFVKIIDFLSNAPEGAVNLYKELINQFGEEANHQDVSSRRQLKSTYYTAAEENKLAVPNEVIERLVDIGYSAGADAFVTMIRKPGAIGAIQAAYSVAAMKKSIRIIRNSAEKASHVISALKTYSHRDSHQQPVEHDVIKDIEMVLTLYYNQTKYGVEIIKSYGDVPPVLCYPEKLHQVWVNIINNALQAMNYKGRLEISVSLFNAWVRVSITDNGPGIPEDIQDKIFEPFFTTKKLGEGTGLGLDIVKRTIDEIGGQIFVDSKPGKTTFHILLKNVKVG